MKRLLVLTIVAMAALVSVASIGVSASLAKEVPALCKAIEKPCESSNVWPEGSTFTAEATAPSDQLVITTFAGKTSCESSTIKGTVGAGQAISITSWDGLGCKNSLKQNCVETTEGLPYSAEVDAEGTLGIQNPQLHFDCGVNLHCTYSYELLGLLHGSGYDSFGVTELLLQQSGSCLGAEPRLTVTYRTPSEAVYYPSTKLVHTSATTEAADHIRVTRATLHGTVNPGGEATSYWFECGTSTEYGTKVPTTPKSAGSGTSNVAVSEVYGGEIGHTLEPSTTYHCRLVAENAAKEVVKGKDVSFTTEAAVSASQLGALVDTDPFDGSASSLADFESNFAALGWAGGTTPKGTDTSSGWKSVDAYPTVNGVYYAPNVNDVGWGLAGTVKVGGLGMSAGRYVSIWIDMEAPALYKGGYELSYAGVSSESCKLTLTKWFEGEEEFLQEAGLPCGGKTIALVDQGSTISAWVDTGTGFTEEFSVSSPWYAGGQVGFDSSGTLTRVKNFRASALRAPRTTTEGASGVTSTQATVNGTVNPEGLSTTYWFEYGATSAYGKKTSTSTKSGTENVAVSKTLNGLTSKTTYHYRLVAESEAGKNYGIDKTFTTP